MLCSNSKTVTITVGARSSPLSRAQVKEVYEALKIHHPDVHFDVHYLQTVGDKDQVTSLRTLDKTNFFTKEIDEGVIRGDYQIGVHSAKDLPDPLPDQLTLFCLTEGVDSSDSLVLPKGETLESLPKGACIATSSVRREDMVKQLRSDLNFCDLRGTIEQRLAKMNGIEIHGIVVAEAALIRLGLTHLNRIRLPGDTVKGQGQLAVVGRKEDHHFQSLFACLDVREL